MNYLKPLDFYKRYGIRDLAMFSTPIPRLLKDLPTDVVVHSLDMGEEITVDLNTPFTQTTGRRVLVNFVRDPLGFNHAIGRKTPVLNSAISKFFQKNTNTLRLTNIANIPSDRQVLVNAYNVIPQLFRYSQTAKISPFYHWLDTYSTIWANASKQAKETNRHHFVFFPIPTELVAKSKLDAYVKSNQETMMRFMTDPTKYALLDLWRWIHKEGRDQSALSMLQEEDLPKMNFVFQLRTGRVIVLNLGFLYSFIKGNPNLTPLRRVRQVSENQLANFVLTFFIRLSRMDTLSDEEQEAIAEGQPDPELEPQDHPESSGADVAGTTSEITGPLGQGKDSEKSFKKGVIAQKEKASEMAPHEKSLDDISQEIEEEIQALEVLEDARDKKRAKETPVEVFGVEEYNPEAGPSREEVLERIFKPKTHQEMAREHLDNAVANGTIDARKYKAAVEILNNQEKMDDPYGSGEPLLKAAEVKPEHMAFKAHDVEKAIDIRVQDPTMAQSPVEAMDKQYIRDCIRRDTLAAFLHAQTAGVLVSDIDTTIHHSIAGGIEEHTLTLKPINGDSSVIRIRKPIVDEDGTFLSNGVRYHKRKMRVDLPLRATDPGRVCISTYIGKIPITRGAKKSQNELEMVIKRLNLASLGGVEGIPKVFTANVLNPQLDAPFVFNALAEHFKGFEIKHPVFGSLHFDLEHDEKHNDQLRVCGKTDKGYPIVVNTNDEFSILTPKGPQPIGTIFELTNLDRTKAPVEPALMKVLGQQVPVGIMVGRSVGFRGMLKALGCKYRMEDASKRVALEPHEYVVRFRDKKFVFDRNDKQAALLMGGFLMAEKQLKLFDVAEFEKKDVYNILLETLGMSPSVPRELDLVESSWIDPCSQRTLAAQGQPTTFLGVLLAGTNLLTSYSAPEVQDFNHQRLWGYESLAGHIHRALYKAIRQQRNKNYSGRAKINMSSFEVWASIREDRSIKTTEDINPIQNLKMHEAVTFVGEGGRMKEAFVQPDRAFTINDVNVISEASVDSGDVGINIFTSANPSLKDVTGVRSDEPVTNQAAKYFSTSDLLAVGSQHDD